MAEDDDLRRRRRRYGATPSASSREPALPAAPPPQFVRAATRTSPDLLRSQISQPPSPPALRNYASSPRPPECVPGKRASELGEQLRRTVATASASSPTKPYHILSFLPAQQAVRTCVLARRWRHLWKSATGLRIVGADGEAPVPFQEVREFVDSLLLLRGSSPLETFELRVTGEAIDVRRVRLWVRYAVECKVQVLLLIFLGDTCARMRPEDPPLASQHLTKLVLLGVMFNYDFLDFSRCPNLQDLHIQDCNFKHIKRISSKSLRHLYHRLIQPELSSTNSCPKSCFIGASSLWWQDSCT